MTNPSIILGLLLAWFASVVGTGLWQRHDGAAQVTAQCADVRATEAAQAATQINALQTQVRDEQERHSIALQGISKGYLNDINKVQSERAAAVAAAGARRVWLSPSATYSVRPGSGPPTEAATPASGCDGQAPGGVPDPNAGTPSASVADLLNLAADADEIVIQLTACQGVISSDRSP